MKYLSLFIILLFSTLANAQSETIKDFEVFPLATGNIALLEGVWRGEDIDIKINDSGFRMGEKPLLWVEVSNYREQETRRGAMYYSTAEEKYKLYMFRARTIIPIDLGILEYSSSYASQQGLACQSGGALLKIEFMVETVFGEVVLTKESCY